MQDEHVNKHESNIETTYIDRTEVGGKMRLSMHLLQSARTSKQAIKKHVMCLKNINTESLNNFIDAFSDAFNPSMRPSRLRFRRANSMEPRIEDFLNALNFIPSDDPNVRSDSAKSESSVNDTVPIYVILEKEEKGDYEVCAVALFTLGYSTWKGRVVNLDLFIAENDDYAIRLMKYLAAISKRLECARIVHQVSFVR